MLKLMSKLRPTPSMVVSVISAIVALGSAGYAATGGTFLLGVKNLATSMTTLKATTNGYGLLVQNTAGPPLALIGKAGKPPLAVNSAVKVKNLNADYLDGFDSSRFLTITKVPFSLAAGATSDLIPVPGNVPIRLVGVTETNGYDSLGEVTLYSSPGRYLDWMGLESIASPSTPTTITSGYGNDTDPGKHIVYIDYVHLVEVELGSPTSVKIRNGASATRSGYLSFTY